MIETPAHEATAERVITNRLTKSKRLYRTIAGLGIATGVVAGFAANTDHTTSTYALLAAGVVGTKVATSVERRKTKIICDDNIEEIAYLNRKDINDAHKSPFDSSNKSKVMPNKNIHAIGATTLGSFLVVNALSENGALDASILNGAPGVGIGSFLVGLAIGQIHISTKLNTLKYQSELFNLSLVHDYPSIDR